MAAVICSFRPPDHPAAKTTPSSMSTSTVAFRHPSPSRYMTQPPTTEAPPTTTTSTASTAANSATSTASTASTSATPPDSSPASARAALVRSPAGHACTVPMASSIAMVPAAAASASSAAVPAPSVTSPAAPTASSPTSPPLHTQRTIRIQSLTHIETLARLDGSTGNGPSILNEPPLQDIKFEISDMPIADIISMVAALLTKITTTNDHQHDALHRVSAARAAHAEAASSATASDTHTSPFSASVLAFHGRNVPAITILSYLTRIHKYCPTTYEVFLSLLVYFDRMTERVNDLVVRDEEERRQALAAAQDHNGQRRPPGQAAPATCSTTASVPGSSDPDVPMRDSDGSESSHDDEMDEGLADSDDSADDDDGGAGNSPTDPAVPPPPGTYFVVDSFNIHRLIISGVTCASKFFSDVFYTNSRYAKVGGLPLAELNHLELQFLILNDFRLAIPLEDLEAYATMLVEFYAREVIGPRPLPPVVLPA